jgi:general secretion pathway protein G
LLELLVIVAVIGTLSTLVVPAVHQHLQRTNVERVIIDINKLDFEITTFEKLEGRYPTDLNELGSGTHIDRYGNPYQYLPSTSKDWKGKARKDRFLVPLNSDFDLYSMGPDGRSRSPLTAKDSRDDIVRANDGRYIGPASEF